MLRFHWLAAPAAAIGLALAAPAAPAQPPIEFPIVFTDRRDGDSEIALRAPDGGVRVLTANRAQDMLATLSPDGRRIAFASDRGGDVDIHVMRRDGSGVRRLTGARGSDTFPAWSPDGRRIVFTSERDGGEPEVYVMRADGTRQRRLTRTGTAVMNLHPRFSPDGRRIVFASSRLSFFNLEIYSMRASDGSGLRRLTFWGTGEDGAPGDDAMPDYSPDGRRIAFVSDRSGSNEIWTMAPDGSDLRQLTDHPRADALLPRWSPDGAAVAYLRSSARGRDTVWIAAADGSGAARLLRGGEADW